jgi:hypothetical protein
MEIITDFLILMQKLQWVMVGLLLVAGLAAAGIGMVRRRLWMVALGALIGGGQFLLPALGNASLAASIEARRAVVRDMPRVHLPVTYPRQMILFGDRMRRSDVERLMVMTDIDEVIIIDYDRKYFSRVDHSVPCREAITALEHLQALGLSSALSEAEIRRHIATERGCLPSSDAAFPLRPNRIEVRFDGRVTRDARGRGVAPRAIQIDLVDNGRSSLVHYDEMPIIASPNSATNLLPDGYAYPCFGFDHGQIIRNILDSALHPTDASRLMQRVRESSTCIQSVAPEIFETFEQRDEWREAFRREQLQRMAARRW